MPSTKINSTTYFVGIEFVAGSYTNVRDDLIRFNCVRGMGTIDKSLRVGEGTLILDNYRKLYSPLNSASPYYGLMTLNKRLKVTATYQSSVRTLFTGRISKININPMPGTKSVNIECVDDLQTALDTSVRVPLQVNVNPGYLITMIASLANITSSLYIDSFSEGVPYIGTSNKTALNLFNDIIKIGDYSILTKGDGTLHFKNRNFKIIETPVASYSEYFNFSYEQTADRVANHVSIRSNSKKLDTNVQTICFLDIPQTLPRSASTNFYLGFINPYNITEQTEAKNVLDPTAGYNYIINQYYDNSGVDLTSQCSVYTAMFGDTVQVSISNVSSYDGYLTTFTLQGNSIYSAGNVSKDRESTTSQNAYGHRDYDIVSQLIEPTLSYLANYAEYLIDRKKDPEDLVSFSLHSIYPDVLDREIGDLIHLTEDETKLNYDCIINAVEHDIGAYQEQVHIVNYGVQKHFDSSYFLIGHATLGKLDTAGNILIF